MCTTAVSLAPEEMWTCRGRIHAAIIVVSLSTPITVAAQAVGDSSYIPVAQRYYSTITLSPFLLVKFPSSFYQLPVSSLCIHSVYLPFTLTSVSFTGSCFSFVTLRCCHGSFQYTFGCSGSMCINALEAFDPEG